MRELTALLAGVESGACGLKARAAERTGVKPVDSWSSARVQPKPRVADGLVVFADQPCAVALRRDSDGSRARGEVFTFSPRPRSAAAQSAQVAGERLRRRAVWTGSVSVGNGGDAKLPPGEIEGDGLDDRGARVDSDEKVRVGHRRAMDENVLENSEGKGSSASPPAPATFVRTGLYV